ncbi:MAG: alkane 1-monooxygenase [Flavobacteriaceae bacterium]|jgi:alkane 1-monooxygenase|nr:alkane 1-monooxygenase [Flavobacteriaceae bacterium]MDG1965455.1 alkane 1-monooxygenase [Flavobacteriaceae bacterium]
MKDAKYLMAFSVPLSVFISIYFREIFSYTSTLYVFLFIPIVELFLPTHLSTFSEQESKSRLKDKFFDWLLYLNVPIVYLILFYGLYSFANYDLQPYEYFGFALSLGILLATNAVNVAHELGHRKNKFDVFVTRLLLLPCLYMHFTMEHNYGHHKNVATELDPASAKKGQSLYHFWITSVFGQYKNAWQIQMKLLKNKKASFISSENNLLLFLIYQGLYLTTIYTLLGEGALMLAFLVGVISFLFLETINYIEHYGLRRKKVENKYEKVQNTHSWNSDHIMGRIILYELTRHSDHHFRASKRYQVLESLEDSPRLPFGYPMSMLLAFVPPLWFAYMHPVLRKME